MGKLADLVPWDEAEEVYVKHFMNNSHPAHPARIALGALIIKQRLKSNDEWTVRHVSENPYLQYLSGFPVFGKKLRLMQVHWFFSVNAFQQIC